MAGSKSPKFVKPATAPNSDINVTPLVDVVLVLLIIFMVLTPLLEKDIEVRVPETEKVEDTTPPDPNDTQIVVQISESGEYSVNTEKIPAGDYVSRLQKMLNSKKKDEKVVFFMADDKASYAKLVTALDGAKMAGAKILGFATEIPEGAVLPGQQGSTPGEAPAPGGATAPTP
ncbi:biopolymer transporter ExbD [Myxococcaceae bacterium GXIMD 01537]